jgi:hypothetical protein
LAQLSGRIFSLGGNQTPQVEPKNLDEATVLCETALMTFEEAHMAVRQRAEMAEAEVVMEQQARQHLAAEVFLARDFICQLGEKLHSMHGGEVPSSGLLNEMTLEEAMAFCEASLGPLKQALAAKSCEDREMSRSTGSSRRLGSQCSEPCSEPAPCSPLLADTFLSNLSGASPDEAARDVLPVVKSDPEALPWEDDLPNCSICNIKFSKRQFKRRHHCRV